ncbi:MAG: protein translocase subunit SecD, partial [Gemmatimonadetes bacterium]|nr:protein translocase subunit SecD [Gemmatimonadota bacterium]
VYLAEGEDGKTPGAEDMEGVRRILESRVNAFGVSEPIVQLLGTPPDRVLIQLPGLKGASITVRFDAGTVTAAELESFFRSPEIGHPEATVEGKEGGSFVVHLDRLEAARLGPDGSVLAEAEAARIRSAIESAFPVRITLAYTQPAPAPEPPGGSEPEEEAGPTPTPTPQGPGLPALEDIEAAVAAAGRPDAAVAEVVPGVFVVTLRGLAGQRTGADGEVVPSDEDRLFGQFRAAGNLELWSPVENKITQWTVGGGLQEAKHLIGQTAQLEFRERKCGDLLPPDEQTPWPPDGLSEVEWVAQRCENPKYFTEKAVDLSGRDLVNAYGGTHPTTGQPVVNIVFNEHGTDEFYDVTDRISRTGDLLAIYLDGKELLAPRAEQGIPGGRAYIYGPDFTAERVRTVAIQLRSGALPVSLSLVQERNVDATLGADSLRQTVIAGIIGLALILVFMVAYYKASGAVAGVALLMFTVFLLAVFKIVPVTLTLAGGAALILSLGMAVDANILIAERTKEELRAGRSLFAAIAEGFDRAWPSIRDSNFSTLITCVVLFWFGQRFATSIMQGFALTLGVGVVLSMFTAFFASRIFMRSLARTPLGRRPSLFVPVGEARAQRAPGG